MTFTPICPRCGSAAVAARAAGKRECTRCCYVAGAGALMRAGLNDGIFDPRKAGFALDDRTIALSDEG